ncbi:uncharacterized protein LOC135350866 isoform X2 [Halichondria panicea]|uniref:uncharacterized protein LOC135350866 isoform X2 n=1 Tax=Halichondria panicea TaxID=6063 RepID=UPI00312B4EE3
MDKDKERPALDWFEQMLELVKSNSSIDHKILKDPSGSLKWLEISSTKCHIDPQLGPIRAVRLVVSTTRTYKVDVLYPIPRSVERLKGLVTDDYESIINIIQESGGHVLCPGIQPEWYEEMYKANGYHRENVRTLQLPIKRYEATDCFLWHKPSNRYTKVGNKLFNVCNNCKREARCSQQNATRNINIDQDIKDARMSASSNYPISRLTPKAQSERLKRLKSENKSNRERLQQLRSKSSIKSIPTKHRSPASLSETNSSCTLDS